MMNSKLNRIYAALFFTITLVFIGGSILLYGIWTMSNANSEIMTWQGIKITLLGYGISAIAFFTSIKFYTLSSKIYRKNKENRGVKNE